MFSDKPNNTLVVCVSRKFSIDFANNYNNITSTPKSIILDQNIADRE